MPDDRHYDRWQFNADLMFKPRPSGVLYFGGGLAVDYLLPERRDNSTDFGGNAFAGMEFGARRSPMNFYLQTRWTFFDETVFSILGGINLALR